MFNKPLLLVLLVSLALNGLFGYLSYAFYNSKQGLKVELVQCQASNVSLEKSAKKAEQVCKIGDELSAEFKQEEQVLEQDRDKILEALDKVKKLELKHSFGADLEDTRMYRWTKEATLNEQDDVAGVDDKLPESIRVLTESACNRVQGKDCTHP